MYHSRRLSTSAIIVTSVVTTRSIVARAGAITHRAVTTRWLRPEKYSRNHVRTTSRQESSFGGWPSTWRIGLRPRQPVLKRGDFRAGFVRQGLHRPDGGQTPRKGRHARHAVRHGRRTNFTLVRPCALAAGRVENQLNLTVGQVVKEVR